MKRLPILYLTLVSLTLTAQESLDIITLSGRMAVPQSYDSIYKGKAQESGFTAGLVVPIKISEKSIWYNGVNYFYWNVDSDNDTHTSEGNQSY